MGGWVYFMTNTHNNVLYIGVTSDLEKRVWGHKTGVKKDCFTHKYNCHKLVHYETFGEIKLAIAREKQLKNWQRNWKNELVDKENPRWLDLSADWQ